MSSKDPKITIPILLLSLVMVLLIIWVAIKITQYVVAVGL